MCKHQNMAGSRKISLNTGKRRVIPDVRKIEVAEGFTQVYDAWLEQLPSLPFVGSGVLFLFWLCARADGEFKGGVRIAKDVVAEFNRYLMENSRKKISKATMYRMVDQMVEQSILRRVERGYYLFNPNYLWRGSKALRDNIIRLEYADHRRLPAILDNEDGFEEIKEITE